MINGASQSVSAPDIPKKDYTSLLPYLRRDSVLTGTYESIKEIKKKEVNEHYTNTPYILESLKFSRRTSLSGCHLAAYQIFSLSGKKRIGFERLSLEDIECLGLIDQVRPSDRIKQGYQGLALFSLLHLTKGQILIEGLLLDNLDSIPAYLLREHFVKATTIADYTKVITTNLLDSNNYPIYNRHFSSSVINEVLVKGNSYNDFSKIDNREIITAYTPLFRDYPEVTQPIAFIAASDDGRFSKELFEIRIIFYALATSLCLVVTCILWFFSKKLYASEDKAEYANLQRDLIIESINAGVIGIDINGLIHFANGHSKSLLSDDLLGKHYGRYVDESVMEIIATNISNIDLISTSPSPSLTKLHRGGFILKDQSRVFCEFAISPLKSNDIHCLIIFRDIREVLALEQAKENAATLAERSRIAREIRDSLANKLAILSIQLQAALKESSSSQLLDRVQKANQLAKDCMVVSDIQSQPFQFSEREDFNLVAYLQKTLNDASYNGLRTSLLLEDEVSPNFLSTWASPIQAIVERSISETVKRSEVTKIQIKLSQQKECLSLTIANDAYRSSNQTADQSFLDVISSIRNDADSLGADLKFSWDSEGTCLKATFPLSYQ